MSFTFEQDVYNSRLDALIIGCATIDFSWRLIYVNEILAELVSYNVEELQNKSIYEILPDFESNPFYQMLMDSMHLRVSTQLVSKAPLPKGGYTWVEVRSVPVPEGIFVQVLDINERKRYQLALEESEARFRKAFHIHPYALALSAADDGVILDANESFLKLFGFTFLEIIGNKAADLNLYAYPEERNRLRMLIDEKNGIKEYEICLRTKSGELLNTLLSVQVFDSNHGKRFLNIIKDITEQKKAEVRINELAQLSALTNAELNAVIESIPDAVYVGTIEGIQRCNQNALKRVGARTLDELNKRLGEIAKTFNIRNIISGLQCEEEELPFVRALNGETVTEELIIQNLETCEDVYVRVAAAPIWLNNKIIGAVAIDSDITQAKKNEKTIKALLKEKEILLQETYHRTKNNMQIVSSLLSLKASAVKNPELSAIVEEITTKIQALSLVHQKLYNSRNLTTLDLDIYIRELAEKLISSYTSSLKKINLELDLDWIQANIEIAIACGLIITEAITNSLKYAFPDNVKGVINVSLKKRESLIVLTLADNGTGLNEKEIKTEKMGIQLIKMIAKDKLDAEALLSSDDGTKWEIIFRDLK